MDTKLTLKLNSEIISEAKSYAKEHNSSVSKLVEKFLKPKLSDSCSKNVGAVSQTTFIMRPVWETCTTVY